MNRLSLNVIERQMHRNGMKLSMIRRTVARAALHQEATRSISIFKDLDRDRVFSSHHPQPTATKSTLSTASLPTFCCAPCEVQNSNL